MSKSSKEIEEIAKAVASALQTQNVEMAKIAAAKVVADATLINGTTRSTTSDHDLLIKINTTVDDLKISVKQLTERDGFYVLKEDYNVFLTAQIKTNDDRETRLRFLERYVWIGIALVGVIEPVLIALFIKY